MTLAAFLPLLHVGVMVAGPQGMAGNYAKLDIGAIPLGTAPGDLLGSSVAALADMDGNGLTDFAVGAPADDRDGANRGAVWVVFAGELGNVIAHRRIDGSAQGIDLDNGDFFGFSQASLGDQDGDGIVDLAVGATGDDDGGANRGAVWILFLNQSGGVRDARKLSQLSGGFSGALDDGDGFGTSVASLGDLDGDGVGDLAVGSEFDDDGAQDTGAAWILFLRSDGTVKSQTKISRTSGGFTGDIDANDRFGTSLARLPDLNGNGVIDLAVGAPRDDDGTTNRGAVWVLFLSANGTVQAHQKISDTQGGFLGNLGLAAQFGRGLAVIEDTNGDSIDDLVVGEPNAVNSSGVPEGALWILQLAATGMVSSSIKLPARAPGFLGTSIASLGDQDANGWPELLAGTPSDTTLGRHGNAWTLALRLGYAEDKASLMPIHDRDWPTLLAPLGDLDADGIEEVAMSTGDGLWVLSMDANLNARASRRVLLFPPPSGTNYSVPDSLATIGDLDGDGIAELAFGTPRDPLCCPYAGVLTILFLQPDGSIRAQRRISSGMNGFTPVLVDYEFFGCAIAPLGDLDGDGIPDIAVGAQHDRTPGSTCCQGQGAVWILFLQPNGQVKGHTKIGLNAGGFVAPPNLGWFGSSLAALDDFDGDGVPELAVGAPATSTGGSVFILFLGSDGRVRAQTWITEESGGLAAAEISDHFGAAVAALGDLDHNGICDLAASAKYDEPPGQPYTERGAVYVLYLAADGTVLTHDEISNAQGLEGLVDQNDFFGSELLAWRDLRWTRSLDLAVFSRGDDDAGLDSKTIWVLPFVERFKVRPAR